LERNESIYIGNDNFGAITIAPDGFRIEFDVLQWLDVNVFMRKHIAAYEVEGEQVWRVPPFAAEPEGFLDEWLHMPWEEANKWIEPSEVADLSEWHQRLRAERLSKGPYSTGFVQHPPACEVEGGIWEVGVELSPRKEGNSLPAWMPEEIYFIIALKNGAYFVKSVSATSTEPKCNPPGKNP
jgi:hypothetical protein